MDYLCNNYYFIHIYVYRECRLAQSWQKLSAYPAVIKIGGKWSLIINVNNLVEVEKIENTETL